MADDLEDAAQWAPRTDGTPKGLGFLGVLKRPDGGVMSEFTVGVPIGGREMDIPTFVPTLTAREVQTLLTLPEGRPIPEPIIDKAVTHALGRLASGKSIFAEQGEQQELLHPQFRRVPVRLTSGDIWLPREAK